MFCLQVATTMLLTLAVTGLFPGGPSCKSNCEQKLEGEKFSSPGGKVECEVEMETSTSESIRLWIYYPIRGQIKLLDHRNVLGVFLIFILMRLNEVCPS